MGKPVVIEAARQSVERPVADPIVLFRQRLSPVFAPTIERI